MFPIRFSRWRQPQDRGRIFNPWRRVFVLRELDGEQPTRNGGLAFGEGNLFIAEIELGVEKVVVTHDEKAVVIKQGKAFPFFGQLIPGEVLRREIEVLKIEKECFLYVIDRLRRVEGLEF